MSEEDKILLAELLKNPVDGTVYLPFSIGGDKPLTDEMIKANCIACEEKTKELQNRKMLIETLTMGIMKDNATNKSENEK